MARVVRCGLIQARCEWSPEKFSLSEIRERMIGKHERLIAQAAKRGVKILGLEELFYGPYFPAEQQTRWYDLTEPVPDGPTCERMRKLAKRHKMVLVVPVYEVEMPGVFFNTAAVFDADGSYLGRYRKHHIPHCHPGFWEKFYFTPGNTGYPVFSTRYARVGVYICYDRHFPEGARILGIALTKRPHGKDGGSGGAWGVGGGRPGEQIHPAGAHLCGPRPLRGDRPGAAARRKAIRSRA